MTKFNAEMIAQIQRLEGIFMPEVGRQREAMRQRAGGDPRFAHYTSADAALKIITSKRLWMRNTTAMVDYSEVEHGNAILQRVVTEDRLKRFSDALDLCVRGAADRAIRKYNTLWTDIKSGTFVTCISEHKTDEDKHGRLSMWRAFNRGGARVALILRLPEYTTATTLLNLIFSPVSYLKEPDVGRIFDEVIGNIASEAAYLRTLPSAQVEYLAFIVLAAAVMCLKHEGFGEELEWRAIYAPWTGRESEYMKDTISTIDGVPQIVYQLPLDGSLSPELLPIDLASMFDHLIIGPTQYESVLVDVFADALTKLGIRDARKRISVSGIPLRF